MSWKSLAPVVRRDEFGRFRSPSVAPVHAPCELASCGREVIRNPGEKPARWLRRRYCSARCRGPGQALAMTRICAHKPCTGCGGDIVQREDETRRRWMALLTCSSRCSQARVQDGSAKARAVALEARANWPALTGSGLSGDCFGRHDVVARDGGILRVPRPATHVETASALG